MATVILRYWKNGTKLPNRITYAHFSLETSHYYFSAHPNMEAAEIKESGSHSVYPLKYVDKEPDLKNMGSPDVELTLDLSEEKVHKVLSVLSTAALQWVPYGMDQPGANSLVLVMLALKRSGYYDMIKRETIQAAAQKQNVADFFCRYVIKKDLLSEYAPLLKILNRDVLPENLLAMAKLKISQASCWRQNAMPLAMAASTIAIGLTYYFLFRTAPGTGENMAAEDLFHSVTSSLNISA